MPNKGGIITVRDTFESEVLLIGKQFANSLKIADDAIINTNKNIKSLADAYKTISKVTSNQEFLEAKKKENLLNLETLNGLKQQTIALKNASIEKQNQIKENNLLALSNDKVKISNNTLEQSEIRLQKAKDGTVKKTVEEKIEEQELAKQLKKEALERLGLTGAYTKLNDARTKAKNTLRDLVAGETASVTQIQKAQKEFDLLDKKVRKADNAVRDFTKDVGNYGLALNEVTSLLSYLGITVGLGQAIKLTEVFSDGLAQLQINMRGTKEQANSVFDDLKNIDTRTSLVDLLGLSEIVAKKGVATSAIAEITTELDKLFLVLGDAIGNKDEGTASIIKLISIFNTDGKVTPERVKAISSELIALSTNGVATGKYLIDFSERVGAFRSLTGQTLPQITGLSAGFEQLGQSVEVAGTATGQIITKLLSDVPKYAKAANIPLKEFRRLLLTDSTEGLLRFAEGLKKNSKNTEEFANSFEDVNLKGARVKSVLAELAINGDLFREKIKLSTDATNDLGKSTENASLKQSTFAGTLDKIKKDFEILVATQKVQDFFSNSAIAVYTLIKLITMIPFSIVIGGLSSWIALKALLNRQLILNTIALNYNNEASLLYKARALGVSLGLIEQTVATGAATVATTELTVATEAATIAEAELAATFALTPWGAIALGVGVLATSLYALATAETEAEKNAKKIKDSLDFAKDTIINKIKGIDKAREDAFKKEEDRQRKLFSYGKSQEEVDKDLAKFKQDYIEKDIENNDKELKRVTERLKVLEVNYTKEKKILEDRIKLNTSLLGKGNEAKDNSLLKSIENDIAKLNELSVNIQTYRKEKQIFNKLKSEEKTNLLKKSDELIIVNRINNSDEELKILKQQYDLVKKLNEDRYKLSQKRLQSEIDLQDELTQNEKLNIDERLNASTESDQIAEAKRRETFEKELKDKGTYNEKSGNFDRELSNKQIDEIVSGGKIVDGLNDDLLLMYETYQNDITEILKKGQRKRDGLIDEDVKKQSSDLEKAFQEQLNQLSFIEEEANKIRGYEEISLLNQKNKGIINEEEYAKKVLDLKTKSAQILFDRQNEYFRDEILAQILADEEKIRNSELSNTDKEKLLKESEKRKLAIVSEFSKLTYDKLSSDATDNEQKELARLKKREQNIKDSSKILADAFGTDASNLENFFNTIYSNFDKLLSGGKLSIEDFAKTFQDSMAIVKDIGNVLFDKRISDIDYEIEKNNNYYDNQIALAENDARKKDLLEKDKKRKNDELEKQKRVQQHKQAVFNKAVTITQIGLQNALAIATAAATTAPTFWAVAIASVIAATQLASAIAIPIPKYRLGRTKGKAERAIINEDVAEVVSGQGGVNPRVYKGKNVMIDLLEDEMVHTSEDAYKRYMKQNSINTVSQKTKNVEDYQANIIINENNAELLLELQKTRKAYEKNKQNIKFQNNVIDIEHSIWSYKNTNWK